MNSPNRPEIPGSTPGVPGPAITVGAVVEQTGVDLELGALRSRRVATVDGDWQAVDPAKSEPIRTVAGRIVS